MSRKDEQSNELSSNDGKESEEEDDRDELQRSKDRALLNAVKRNDTAGVRQALRNGANVNCVGENYYDTTPLIKACEGGHDEIVRIASFGRWCGSVVD